ncbi:hypothetical protein [Streptomyces sp. cmx-4-9]|uniref:hypothetical protein n=1 Tax=Streptomyces sp. cmx-4-9 TaxID=2790941 RepID=UPI00397F4440
MYEMRIGPGNTATGMAWHVTPKAQQTALCGQHLLETDPALHPTTETHCPPCMESFQQAMQTGHAAA